MSAEIPRPAPIRFDGFKVLDAEKLLQWFAQTAEEAIGLDYELSQIRAANKDPAE